MAPIDTPATALSVTFWPLRYRVVDHVEQAGDAAIFVGAERAATLQYQADFHRFRRRLMLCSHASGSPVQTIPRIIPMPIPTRPAARFNLYPAIAAVSSLSDRSRLVLPDVTIAKVGSAWVRSRYRQRTTW